MRKPPAPRSAAASVVEPQREQWKIRAAGAIVLLAPCPAAPAAARMRSVQRHLPTLIIRSQAASSRFYYTRIHTGRKNTGMCAGAMPYRRDVSATTRF